MLAERRVPLSTFDPADVGAVEVREMSKSFLRDASFRANLAERSPVGDVCH